MGKRKQKQFSHFYRSSLIIMGEKSEYKLHIEKQNQQWVSLLAFVV